MDVTCKTCREPWDLYGLVHEDKILAEPERLPGTDVYRKVTTEGETWWFVALEGLDEAAEGCLEVFGCPCCPNDAGDLDDRVRRRLGLV